MLEGKFNAQELGPVLQSLGFFPKIVGGGIYQEAGLPDFFGGFMGVSVGIEVKRNDNGLSVDQIKQRDALLPHGLWFLYRYFDNPKLRHQFKCWNSGIIHQLDAPNRLDIARVLFTEGKEFLKPRWKDL